MFIGWVDEIDVFENVKYQISNRISHYLFEQSFLIFCTDSRTIVDHYHHQFAVRARRTCTVHRMLASVDEVLDSVVENMIVNLQCKKMHQ